MSNPISNNPILAIGRAMDDPEVRAWLDGVDPKTKTKKDREANEVHWSSGTGGLEIQGHLGTLRITTVSFYAQSPDFQAYRGAVPHGISFAMTRDAVRAAMKDAPHFTSEMHDTWDFDDHRFIVMYKKSGEIRDVAITGDF